MPSSPPFDPRLRLIVESYRRLTGKPLLELPSPCRGRAVEGVETVLLNDSTPTLTLPLQGGGDEEMSALREAMWAAPFAIVAHGIEADPMFFYGNRLALQFFEMSFDEFTRLPSRHSAEPIAREARDKLMAQVSSLGYVDGYSGMRIAKNGRKFMITNATIWNVADDAGILHGQAAVFDAA